MRSQPRILLLNPPASSPVLRDYYCSTRPKALYYWQPIDLLCLAARLKDRARLLMLDAIANRLSARQALKTIEAFSPDAIYCMVSARTFSQDMAFLKKVSNAKNRVVLGGEAALDPDFCFEAFPFVDALCLDFTAPELAGFLLEAKAFGRMRTRDRAPDPPPEGGEYSMGVTPHNLMDNALYKLPLWRGVFHSLLTDFGCPHRCSFCNSGKDSLGYKTRNLQEVQQELDLLKRLEARRIYLRDMTFGADRNHGLEVLGLLAAYPFTLRGYLRADQITRPFVKALKKAGFALAQIGVESPSFVTRNAMGKGIKNEVFYKAFRLLHEHGIEAGAHFVVGHAQDSSLIAADCICMARKIGAAYCSINIVEDRVGARPVLVSDSLRRPWFYAHAQVMMAMYNGPRQAHFLLHQY